MWWVLGGKFSVGFPQEKWAYNWSPRTSPHSSLQEKKFVTWKSLWEHPHLINWDRNKLDPDLGWRLCMSLHAQTDVVTVLNSKHRQQHLLALTS